MMCQSLAEMSITLFTHPQDEWRFSIECLNIYGATLRYSIRFSYS
jgi:hypothetical protein